MAQRHNIVLPDNISAELELLAAERGTTKDELIVRALKLYYAAFEGRKRGLAVGLADPDSCLLKTEFVGL